MIERGQWDPDAHGPLTEAAMRRWLAAQGYAVSCYTYPPGTVFPPHLHPVDKIDAVLSGRFRIRIEGADVDLHAGQWLHVPRGALHSAEVVGAEEVVSLDAVRR